MSIDNVSHQPRIVVLGTSAADQPWSVDLAGHEVHVGRSGESDVYLDDPHVSRRHAVIRQSGGQYFVEDLHSSAGTRVNGVPTHDAVALRDGDTITFATVRVRYESGDDGTRLMPQEVPAQVPKAAHFDVRDQNGRVINNIGRDQYYAYVNQVMQQRESFLREIARTRSKARVLAWLGFLLTVGGFLVYAWVILRFVQRVPTLGPGSAPELFGPEIGGVPVGLLGFGAAAIGSILLVVGIVLHIIAAARRRRTDRELPLPPPYEQTDWSDR